MSKSSTIISIIQIDVFRVQLSWPVLFLLVNPKQVFSLLGLNHYSVLSGIVAFLPEKSENFSKMKNSLSILSN